MAPTTIHAFATEETARRQSAADDAQTELASAQTALRAARDALVARTEELAAHNASVADLRRRIAEAVMPADVTALAGDLEDAIMQQRAKQAELLDAQDAADAASRRAQVAADEVAAAIRALANANAALVEAAAGETERAGYRAALAAAPLAGLPGAAATAKTGAAAPAAAPRVKDIPTEQRTAATARRALEYTRVAGLRTFLYDAQDDLGELLAGDTGAAGAVAQKRIAFLRAEARLREWVRSAEERYARALALLAAAADTPPPTPEELARLTDTTLVDAAKAAAVKEAARDSAQEAFDAAQRAYDEALLDVLATDPEAVPAPGDDDTLDEKQADLDAAETALGTAVGEYTDAMTTALQRWEATVPEPLWRALDAYAEAHRLLDELAAGPGTRAADASAAELAYATALDEEAERGRARALVEAAVVTRQGAADAGSSALASRALSAVRGDVWEAA
jgi:hypothetical protein